MQVFLHFSSHQPHTLFHEFVTEWQKMCDGSALVTLSQSEEIGCAAFFSAPSADHFLKMRAAGAEQQIDVNLLDSPPKIRPLMLCDMDSTIIKSESLDHLSELAGIAEQIVPITRRAMAGEIDFEDALSQRLAMLKDYPAALLDKIISDTHTFSGARQLVQTMRAHDATCLLVSGGFTFLTRHIADKLGFHQDFANDLAVEGDKLSGFAHPPILDSRAKVRVLNEFCDKLGITHDEALCMGDGANDIPMLETAGLGIAWQGKPLVRQHIALQLNHSTLCGALFLQGIAEKDITS